MTLKPLAFFAASMAFLLSLTACQKASVAIEPDDASISETLVSEEYDYEWQAYIVPGGYTQIEIPSAEAEITDELIDARIRETLSSLSELRPVTDRSIESGDTVYLDYTLTPDGEAPVTETILIVVGFHDLLPGLDDYLLGASAGDTVTASLDCPEDYWDELYAGKTVEVSADILEVFEETLPPLNDELVKVISEGSSTVEEYREEVRLDLEADYRDSVSLSRETILWQKALERTDVLGYPEAEVKAEEEAILDEYRQAAEEEGFTYEDYRDLYLDAGEDIEQQAKDTAKAKVLQKLLQQAIVDLEELTISDEDYTRLGELHAPDQGYKTLADWEKEAGKNAVLDEVTYRLVTEFLEHHASVVENEEDTADVLGLSAWLEQEV